MQLKGKVISFFLGAKNAKHKPLQAMIYSLDITCHLKNQTGNLWKFMNNVLSNVIFSTEIHGYLQYNEFFFPLNVQALNICY